MFWKKVKLEDIEERRERMISEIKKRINLPEINDDIRYSLDMGAFEAAEKRLNKWKDDHANATFQEELLDRIAESHMTHVAFYKKAHLDRKRFSAIKKYRDYNPLKQTAVACCLALQLDLDETKALLEKAGYALTDAKQWDVLIKHCIERGYYDIDDVNYILDYFGEKPIGY